MCLEKHFHLWHVCTWFFVVNSFRSVYFTCTHCSCAECIVLILAALYLLILDCLLALHEFIPHSDSQSQSRVPRLLRHPRVTCDLTHGWTCTDGYMALHRICASQASLRPALGPERSPLTNAARCSVRLVASGRRSVVCSIPHPGATRN